MGCGTSFVKYVLFFFNLIVALFGLAVIGIGVAVLLNWSVIRDVLEGHLTVAPWVFIVIGAIMFIIAFFGCCGAIRESHCMTVTYAIFLLVIIIVQVILAVLMFTYADNIKDGLVTTVNKMFERRAVDPASATVFNNLQQQLECCGKTSATDYGVLSVPNLPRSCCSHLGAVGKLLGDTCSIADANTIGCSDRVANLYERWNKTIAGVAIGVACVEVVGALFALCLANSIRNMDRSFYRPLYSKHHLIYLRCGAGPRGEDTLTTKRANANTLLQHHVETHLSIICMQGILSKLDDHDPQL